MFCWILATQKKIEGRFTKLILMILWNFMFVPVCLCLFVEKIDLISISVAMMLLKFSNAPKSLTSFDSTSPGTPTMVFLQSLGHDILWRVMSNCNRIEARHHHREKGALFYKFIGVCSLPFALHFSGALSWKNMYYMVLPWSYSSQSIRPIPKKHWNLLSRYASRDINYAYRHIYIYIHIHTCIYILIYVL